MLMKKFTRTKEDFTCENCGHFVRGDGYTNHCPFCLWSKHVDINPGDREATCRGLMEPIGVELKEGKYILLNRCVKCGLKKRNKISKDDNFDTILQLVNQMNGQSLKDTPGFVCIACKKQVPISRDMGTKNRNHCPFCLSSLHVDSLIPGDRQAQCKKEMEPLGLTFKKIRGNKYKKENKGELMLVHQCVGCNKISLNRIAGDDDPKKILGVFTGSLKIAPELKEELKTLNIELATTKNLEEIKTQLFGKL